ncbi:MAG: hypothetical protein WBD40_19180 [Tepidisphaeraceae bacterium]
MKVRLKKASRRHPDLTAGNVYRVIGIEADDYRLLNDFGRPYLYPPELFELVDPKRPREWQSVVGEDGEEYAYPKLFGRPGFFEDYFDNDVRAVQALHTYLDRAHLPNRLKRAESA